MVEPAFFTILNNLLLQHWVDYYLKTTSVRMHATCHDKPIFKWFQELFLFFFAKNVYRPPSRSGCKKIFALTGELCKFSVEMCCWDSKTLTLYQDHTRLHWLTLFYTYTLKLATLSQTCSVSIQILH